MIADTIIIIMVILSPIDSVKQDAKQFKIDMQKLQDVSDKAARKATQKTCTDFKKYCLKRKSEKDEKH